MPYKYNLKKKLKTVLCVKYLKRAIAQSSQEGHKVRRQDVVCLVCAPITSFTCSDLLLFFTGTSRCHSTKACRGLGTQWAAQMSQFITQCYSQDEVFRKCNSKSVLHLHKMIFLFLVCVPEVTYISISGKPRQVMAISSWQLKPLCINIENSKKTVFF